MLTANGWVKQPDIPNVDAKLVFHRDLDKPMVTRLPDGSWWLRPAIGRGGMDGGDGPEGKTDG